jgi:hypothetical protein
VKLYRCAYYNQCKCPARFRTLEDLETGEIELQKATNIEHGDHSVNNMKRGASKHTIIAAVSSPSHLRKGPKQLLGKAARTLKSSMSSVDQRSVTRKLQRLRTKYDTGDLTNGGDGGHYGDVVDQLKTKFLRSSIGESFHDNTVYLLRDEVVVKQCLVLNEKTGKEEERKRFYCVLSTENLLLNSSATTGSLYSSFHFCIILHF